MTSITQDLINIENDHRATRTSLKLNYGALKTPESSPTATWSGNVANTDMAGDDELAAKWRITFIRTDDIDLPPPVDIAFDYTVQDNMKSLVDEAIFRLSGESTGSNYVTYTLGLVGGATGFYNPYNNTTAFTITAQAVSTIEGNLTIVRVYD